MVAIGFRSGQARARPARKSAIANDILFHPVDRDAQQETVRADIQAAAATGRQAADQTQREAQPQQLDAGISDDDRHRRIGLLIEEDDLASQMTQTLDSFGYQVIHLESPEALQEAAPLDALIIDTSPPGSRLLGHPVFQQAASQLPPLLIISSLDTFASRLQAVRAGAVGFFTKPVDLPLLERRLERGFNKAEIGELVEAGTVVENQGPGTRS